MSFKSGVKGRGSDSDETVTVIKWYALDEVNLEDSEQNEVDGMKKGVD